MKFFSIILYLFLPGLLLEAQEPSSPKVISPQVIITELRCKSGVEAYSNYIELTNVSDTLVNLGDYFLLNRNSPSQKLKVDYGEDDQILKIHWNTESNISEKYFTKLPDTTMAPGMSFVIVNVFDDVGLDGKPLQSEAMVKTAKMFIHCEESSGSESLVNTAYNDLQNYSFDSVSVAYELLMAQEYSAYILFRQIYNDLGEVIDTLAVDGTQHFFTEDGGGTTEISTIAGVPEALKTHIIVRKSNVSRGNLNWELSKGTSAENSEWICLPDFNGNEIRNTAGVHGSYNISFDSEEYTINHSTKSISVPWGTKRGDCFFQELVMGPGMAWEYVEDTTEPYSSEHTICTSGDKIVLYATSTSLEKEIYSIDVMRAAHSECRVFPRRIPDHSGYSGFPGKDAPIYVTQHENIMDTIGNLYFNTRIDTLFRYLEKYWLSTWEIIYADGKGDIDINKGDILKVTAENGITTKVYYLDGLDYIPGTNADLSCITWPDKPGHLSGWNQDTIPGFSYLKKRYFINLPENSNTVPALQITTTDPNARAKILPAKSLSGPKEDRTTVIDVRSEDNMIVNTYYVTFTLENTSVPGSKAEPFFSEILGNQYNWNSYLEICNPGGNYIDLSGYMLVVSDSPDPEEAVTNVIPFVEKDWTYRYHTGSAYVPGYKWPAAKAEWDAHPGRLVLDTITDPSVSPGGVWVLASGYSGAGNVRVAEANVVLGGTTQKWGEKDISDRCMLEWPRHPNRTIFMFKILNDSIRTGTKAIKDPADFELIEYMGFSETNTWDIAGRNIPYNAVFTLIRKDGINTPGTGYKRGWGTDAANSDWIVIRPGDVHDGLHINSQNIDFNIGNHAFKPVTSHMANVFSYVYKVDDDLKKISGVSHGETVEIFLANLIKADTGQILRVLGSSDGTEKESSGLMEENDTLWATSSDKGDHMKYTVSLLALDNNTNLSAINGSGIEIIMNDTNGYITGFSFGTSIKEILDNIVKPEKSILNVLNDDGELLPLLSRNYANQKMATIADENTRFEVIAENNTDRFVYCLQPLSGSAAYVLSDVYLVLQDNYPSVRSIPGGTSVSTLFSNLKPVPGATLRVQDKLRRTRSSGLVAYDDLLFVTLQDSSSYKAYFLDFIPEKEGLNSPYLLFVDSLQLLELSPTATEATISWKGGGTVFGYVVLRNGIIIDTVYNQKFTDTGLIRGNIYEYSVYSFNGIQLSSNTISILVQAWHTGVTPDAKDEIKIYPSITSDYIYFRNLPEACKVLIYDLQGRNMVIKNAGELTEGMSLHEYSGGFYIIRILLNNECIKTGKVLKH